MEKFLALLQKILGTYRNVKFFTVSWFMRLVWAPCILWGIYDGVLYMIGKDTSSDNLANFYIRTIAGFILFLIWYFLIRPKGKKDVDGIGPDTY